jgi:hypothetical protein
MVQVTQDQDGLAAVAQRRRLFGWKLLAPCLALSVLAFGAAAFYVGWTMGQDAIRVPLAWRDIPPSGRPNIGQAWTEVILPVVFGHGPYETSWADSTHEIVVHENPHLSADHAYPIGASTEQTIEQRAWIHVSMTSELDGLRQIEIRRSYETGAWSDVQLRFLLRDQVLSAAVESVEQGWPQPLPQWDDVNGTVSISSWDWEQTKPVVIAYNLYGKCGGFWRCAHDKIVLAQ